jgi:hypothetical protein
MRAVSTDANLFNAGCACVGADIDAVHETVGLRPGAPYDSLFSELPVAISSSDVRRMQSVIDAVERVVALPIYREAALGAAPGTARVPQPAHGVFLGFDFHIGTNGPRLIEINTNAGGAMLSLAVRHGQRECCPEVRDYLRTAPDSSALRREILAMFESEWRLARGDAPLVIADDSPREQFLFPEFQMFQRLFADHGWDALIVDARELRFDGTQLLAGREPVDLVYNRCTDFYLGAPEHAALAAAYVSGAALVTPHPQAHALYASKGNLVMLTDRAFLTKAGVAASDIEVLIEHIPETRLLEQGAERWWSQRKRWFFKPVDGFGSRGSYRGDKMTRRVFEEVLRGRYVAQEFSPPGERRVRVGDTTATFKVDVRNFVYSGRVQQRIARLYQGQTTNFRTAGGGFAPVFVAAE